MIVIALALLIFKPETAAYEQPPQKFVSEFPMGTDWTPERIKEEIRQVFPENAETMIAIAKCESGLDRNALGPTNDHGVFQVHLPSHRERVEDIDLTDPAENIRFARVLYDESGLKPWNASRQCWSSV